MCPRCIREASGFLYDNIIYIYVYTHIYITQCLWLLPCFLCFVFLILNEFSLPIGWNRVLPDAQWQLVTFLSYLFSHLPYISYINVQHIENHKDLLQIKQIVIEALQGFSDRVMWHSGRAVFICSQQSVGWNYISILKFQTNDTKPKFNSSLDFGITGWREQSLGSHVSGHMALVGIQVIYHLNKYYYTRDCRWCYIYYWTGETYFPLIPPPAHQDPNSCHFLVVYVFHYNHHHRRCYVMKTTWKIIYHLIKI